MLHGITVLINFQGKVKIKETISREMLFSRMLYNSDDINGGARILDHRGKIK
jgi:hypothetical protein